MSDDTFRMANKHWESIRRRLIRGGIVTLVFAIAVGSVCFHWTINRIYAPPKHSVLLRYKGPPLPIPFLGCEAGCNAGSVREGR